MPRRCVSARVLPVSARAPQRGDLAIVDFSASRADTGEELLGAERRSMRLDTDDADRTFLPGIVDILMGMRAGEERVAPLVFPTDGAPGPAPAAAAAVAAASVVAGSAGGGCGGAGTRCIQRSFCWLAGCLHWARSNSSG